MPCCTNTTSIRVGAVLLAAVNRNGSMGKGSPAMDSRADSKTNRRMIINACKTPVLPEPLAP